MIVCVYKNTYHPAVQAFRCSGVQKAGTERLFREKEMTVEMVLGFWLLSGEEGTQSVFAYDPADTTLADQMRNTINLRLSMGAAMTRTTAPFALKFVRDNFGAVTWSGDRKLAKLRALRAEIAKVKEWIKCASRWTRTGYKASASDERATYREVHIHQRCET